MTQNLKRHPKYSASYKKGTAKIDSIRLTSFRRRHDGCADMDVKSEVCGFLGAVKYSCYDVVRFGTLERKFRRTYSHHLLVVSQLPPDVNDF